MCQSIISLYCCGHSDVTILQPCDRATGSSQHSDDDTSLLYQSNRDCGSGGELLTCLQKRALTDSQQRVLKICETRVRRAQKQYFALSDRVGEIKTQFKDSERGRMTLELEESLRKASMARDIAAQKLLAKFKKSGERILERKNVLKQDLIKQGRHSGAPIDWWSSTALPKFRKAVENLEIEVSRFQEKTKEEEEAIKSPQVVPQIPEVTNAEIAQNEPVPAGPEKFVMPLRRWSFLGLTKPVAQDGFDIDIYGDETYV